MTLPEWADKYRRLAKEAGARSGKWHTKTVEVARGPMMAVTEPGVRVITVKTCTQLLKTALLENIFGYHAHVDPSPMLAVQPKDEAVEAFSKERIAPMIRATPALRRIMGDRKTRTSDDTLRYKQFPGGYLALVAAGSPTNMAMRAIRITLSDEIDKYVPTKEGNPIDLIEERQETYAHTSLAVRACSPTDENSAIDASYEASDQRRASVPCPHCGHRMFLDFFKHVHWDKGEDGEHLTATAHIACEACGTLWAEAERLAALKSIRWHQTRPFTCCGRHHDPLTEYQGLWNTPDTDPFSLWRWDNQAVYRIICPDCQSYAVSNQHAGFTASKLYSPWRSIAWVAAKWIAAKDDEDKKQTFYNTQLGVKYRRRAGKEIKPDILRSRREVYTADVPDGVAVLSVGADTQPDRLEAEVVGWGRDEESWSIDYEVFMGDPNQPEVWEKFDEYLQKRWLRADGRPFVVEAACVDSGGHNTQAVYDFCKARTGRKIWAIKGASEVHGRSPIWPVRRIKRSKNYRPVLIGTNAAKDIVNASLLVAAPGPKYCHFPADRETEWFDQITGEIQKTKVRNGKRSLIWVGLPGRRNEALDTRVYALAALKGLEYHGLKLNRRADAVGATVSAPIILAGTPEAERLETVRHHRPPVERPVERKTHRRRKVQRSNFMES